MCSFMPVNSDNIQSLYLTVQISVLTSTFVNRVFPLTCTLCKISWIRFCHYVIFVKIGYILFVVHLLCAAWNIVIPYHLVVRKCSLKLLNWIHNATARVLTGARKSTCASLKLTTLVYLI